MVRYFMAIGAIGVAVVAGACAGHGGTAESGLPSAPSAVPSPTVPSSVRTSPDLTPGPPVTRTITGIVVDEEDRPLPGVAVTAPNGTRFITDGSGSFHFVFEAPVPKPQQYEGNVLCEKDGYESVRQGLTRDADVTVRPRMLRAIVLMDSSHATALLVAGFSYWVGEAYQDDYCTQCKRIRLRTSMPGQVRVTVRWDGPAAVHAWALDGMIAVAAGPDPQSLTFDVPVSGEALAYIGIRSAPTAPTIPVDITTTLLGR
jgi:hypothetical protein